MAKPTIEPYKNVALVLRQLSDHLRGNLYGILSYVRRNTSWRIHTEGAVPVLRWEQLPDWRGDGIIVAIDLPEHLEVVTATELPTVNVSSRVFDYLRIPSVVSDNVAIGKSAADHLLECGLKRFAFVGPMDLAHNVDRLKGFSQAVTAAGHTCAVCEIEFVQRRRELDELSVIDTRRLGRQLRGLKQPVGVFAPHDDIGCWVLKACAESGLSVPSEIAVIGVNNYELLCESAQPPLSSVAQASHRIGYEAACLLGQLMVDGSPTLNSRFIPPSDVVARRSSDVLAVEDEDVADALQFIRNHADVPIAIADILESVVVSRRSLEIRFRRCLDHSIEQEIRGVHITRAKQLLGQTTMPITQVALNSGYRSSTGFSVAFRKETGMSPREYRKQWRGG
jgi:LacI family transcriptional regulator